MLSFEGWITRSRPHDWTQLEKVECGNSECASLIGTETESKSIQY